MVTVVMTVLMVVVMVMTMTMKTVMTIVVAMTVMTMIMMMMTLKPVMTIVVTMNVMMMTMMMMTRTIMMMMMMMMMVRNLAELMAQNFTVLDFQGPRSQTSSCPKRRPREMCVKLLPRFLVVAVCIDNVLAGLTVQAWCWQRSCSNPELAEGLRPPCKIPVLSEMNLCRFS